MRKIYDVVLEKQIYDPHDINEVIIFDACYVNNKMAIEIMLDHMLLPEYYRAIILYFPMNEDNFSKTIIGKMNIIHVVNILVACKNFLIQLDRYEPVLMATICRIINMYSEKKLMDVNFCKPLLADETIYVHFKKYKDHKEFIVWLTHLSYITKSHALFEYICQTFPEHVEKYNNSVKEKLIKIE